MQYRLLKAVILDWAGTAVDFGSLAPVAALQRVFAENDVPISAAEAREHMGTLKKDQIRSICAGARVSEAWTKRYGKPPAEDDVERIFSEFLPRQTEILAEFSSPIRGVVETVAAWRDAGLRIGSTTGYTRALLEVVMTAAVRQGYSPDASATPDEVAEGRPKPFMCYRNAILLGVYPLWHCVKIGDTAVDIAEGLNAGMWTIGITATGNEIGLSQEEWEALAPETRCARERQAAARLRGTGAHFTASSLANCTPILDEIERRLAAGERPTPGPLGDKLLFTPGPLTTSATVKSAMLRDAGSRDADFLAVVREIRERLLGIGGAGSGGYECVLMQGSGTFAIESVISSAIPRDGRLLVLVNGAYGRRIARMARIHGIDTETLDIPENRKITGSAVAERLAAGVAFTYVAVIHCETTTGIVNPIEEIGAVVAQAGAKYIVDAMSSFGAIPIDLERVHAGFVISSANKCIEGVPGFAFVLARREALMAAKGQARTLSLDLHAQWAGLENDGQFRFTPPTHVLLAFRQALLELEAEGGVAGRAARYARNHAVLAAGMAELGFQPYLDVRDQSYIITTYRYPSNPEFDFEAFYTQLSEMGYIIYPGKLSQEPCFRIGTIGRLSAADIEGLLGAIRLVMRVMTSLTA